MCKPYWLYWRQKLFFLFIILLFYIYLFFFLYTLLRIVSKWLVTQVLNAHQPLTHLILRNVGRCIYFVVACWYTVADIRFNAAETPFCQHVWKGFGNNNNMTVWYDHCINIYFLNSKYTSCADLPAQLSCLVILKLYRLSSKT